MGTATAIEYCDSTVNPVMGCTGCELWHRDPAQNHCYAATLCGRRSGKGWPANFHCPEHFPGRLEQAIRWPDLTGTDRPGSRNGTGTMKPWLNGLPRVVFVNDLGDGFCPTAPDPWQWLEPHIEAMAASPHVWLFLTKWPERMVDFFTAYKWVPSNFILGTTVTSQGTGWRFEHLLKAATQFGQDTHFWLSIEPLLGPIELTDPCLDAFCYDFPDVAQLLRDYGHTLWIAAGGESGANARQCAVPWVHQLRDQCQRAGVPFFWKQWGTWLPVWDSYATPEGYTYTRGNKRDNGRSIEGHEWSQMPTFLKGE